MGSGLGGRGLLTLCALALSPAGCASEAACDLIVGQSTLVTVTDKTAGQPVCGATVQAAFPTMSDAMVGQTTFLAVGGDAACSGEYRGFLFISGPGVIEITKLGYETATTTVTGAPTGCSGTPVPQEVSVVLTPQP